MGPCVGPARRPSWESEGNLLTYSMSIISSGESNSAISWTVLRKISIGIRNKSLHCRTAVQIVESPNFHVNPIFIHRSQVYFTLVMTTKMHLLDSMPSAWISVYPTVFPWEDLYQFQFLSLHSYLSFMKPMKPHLGCTITSSVFITNLRVSKSWVRYWLVDGLLNLVLDSGNLSTGPGCIALILAIVFVILVGISAHRNFTVHNLPYFAFEEIHHASCRSHLLPLNITFGNRIIDWPYHLSLLERRAYTEE